MRNRRRSRVRLWLLLATLVAVAGGALYVRNLTSYRPPSPPPVTRAEAVQARRSIGAVEKTLKQTTTAAKHGRRAPFHVALNDRDLTAYVATEKKVKARLAADGIRSPRFRFSSGRVTVSGLMKYSGREVYVSVNGKPVSGKDGRVRFTDVGVRVGRMNVPMLAAKARQLMDEYFNSTNTRLPAAVTQITVEDGELTVRGVSRPPSL